MDKKTMQKATKMAIEDGFDDVKYIGHWKGYDVIDPFYSDGEVRYTGFPLFILVKGNKLRWTNSNEESVQIMKSLFSPK